MKVSHETFEKIKMFEGCRLKAYKCSAGVWTIGYGHTKGVEEGMTITREAADELLDCDLMKYEREVSRMGQWTQNQFDALVSFAYNLGVASLKNSTLLKKIRLGAGQEEIRREFMRWIYADGKPLEGLRKRRAWEADTFNRPTEI